MTSGGAWEEPVKVRHASFEAGIALIKRTFAVVRVDGGVDYRTLPHLDHSEGFKSGSYIVVDHDRPPVDDAAAIALGSRSLRARAARGGEVVVDFADLCELPVGASDVAQLAALFRSWRVENVPRLSTCSPEAAQRFVNFIDVLCDADVRLVVTSRWARGELVSGGRMPPDIARVQSRLALLSATPSTAEDNVNRHVNAPPV